MGGRWPDTMAVRVRHSNSDRSGLSISWFIRRGATGAKLRNAMHPGSESTFPACSPGRAAVSYRADSRHVYQGEESDSDRTVMHDTRECSEHFREIEFPTQPMTVTRSGNLNGLNLGTSHSRRN